MHTSTFHSISRPVLPLLLALALAACHEAPSPPLELGPEPVARFLVDPPQQLLDLDSLYTPQETTSWSWRRRQEVDAWRVEPLPEGTQPKQTSTGPPPETAADATAGQRGLELHGPSRLVRDLALPAADVQRLEVELDPQMGAAGLRLLWRRDDEPTLPRRRHLSAGPPGKRRNAPQRYVFHVARAASWRGTIAELVLEVRPQGAKAPRLQRMVAIGRRLNTAQLATVAGRGILVELDHDVREAYLAPPGSAVTRQLDIATGDRLRFAYGTEATVRHDVLFRVVVDAASDSGNDPSSATGGDVLWQSRVGLGDRTWGAWHMADVDLTPAAGRARRLRLETSMAGDAVPDEGAASAASSTAVASHEGFPLWGHPEVLRATATADESTTDPSTAETNTQGHRPYNLLFISLDTVRADRLSLYGHPKPTSPRLDAWAQSHGVVFEQAVAAAPWTLPSHMTLFSGLDALHHGINHDVGGAQNGRERGFELLAEMLRRRGYATAATTGGAYMHPKYGFSHGFQSYRYWHDRARDDDELVDGIDRTLEFIRQDHGRPFFFFFHTYAAHDPYEAHQPYFDAVAPPGIEPVDGEIALHSPGNRPELAFEQQISFELRQNKGKRTLDASDRALLEAFYDSGLARLDAELGRLLQGLETSGRLDDTLVVITSDHGENLFDQGHRVGHLDLYDSNLLVPLVMSWPDGRGAGRRIAQQVRAVDLLPTLMESLGFPPPEVDGISLLPLVDAATPEDLPADLTAPFDDAWSYCASANRGLALRRPDSKLIVNNNAWRPAHLEVSELVAEAHEFFRLDVDPREGDDLWTGISPPAADAEALREQLGAYWQDFGRGLRLTLHHPGPGTLVGQLKGPMIRPVGTKSIDLTCHCLTWDTMGQATFQLAAGDTFTLQFEKVFGPKLEITGYFDDGSQRRKLHHTFDADRLPTAGFVHWQDGKWQVQDADSGPVATDSGPSLHLYWQGARRQAADSPSLSDPELRRQLEALGYL